MGGNLSRPRHYILLVFVVLVEVLVVSTPAVGVADFELVVVSAPATGDAALSSTVLDVLVTVVSAALCFEQALRPSAATAAITRTFFILVTPIVIDQSFKS